MEKKRKKVEGQQSLTKFFKSVPGPEGVAKPDNNQHENQTKAVLTSTSELDNKKPTSKSDGEATSTTAAGTAAIVTTSDSSTGTENSQEPHTISSTSSVPVPQTKCGPWTGEECRAAIEQLFDSSQLVHNCFSCNQKDCTSISSHEIQRLTPKKFKHNWLNKENWWLCYVEGEGMFCLICRKHNMKHRQNLKEVFAATPSVRVKVDAVTTHSTSTLHSSALESELLQRMSYFHKETTKKSAVQNTTLEQVFATAYFLMKSFIANRQFIPMLTFVEKVFDVESVKYFQHRSAGAQTEIFLTMGNTMKKEVLRKVKSAQAFGILTDEVADVSVTENLVTFIQFYCRETDQVETQFLSCQNVLENFQSANAEAIATLLLKEIEELDDLDLGCFTGLTSDGASVMVGKRSGVAARLKQVNPTLINVHCICHRLALACTDSNESLSNIKDVETWLRQLWQFFENSPKRMAAYLKIQTQLKSIRLEGKGVKRVIKRLKKACRTRWLSLEASVKAVHEDYEAVLQTLAQFEQKDATASGLFRKMKSLKFLGVIYIMREVLPVLGDLSRRFQKGSLNFAAILPAINMTKDRLQNLSEDETPLNNLRNDIDSFTDMCADIKMNKNDGQQLQSVFSKYVVALVSNIDNRFSDSSEVLTAFNIFNPTAVPDSAAEMRTYGNQQIDILSNHYFSENQDRSDKLKAQWHAMKYHIRDAIKPNLPESVKSGSDISPTEWLLLQLLKDTSVRQLYPDIVYIAEVVASLPVSNAWPERGASALKSVKTRLRNRLSSSMLESILHICINAPEPSSAAGQKLVEKAVKSWLENKSRRKLPKIASAPGLSYNNTSHEPVVMMEETGVQTEPMDQDVPEREEWIKKAVDLAIKKLNLDQYGSDDEDDDDWSDDDACCS